MRSGQSWSSDIPFLPACVDAEQASKMLGWPVYFMPLLMKAGHLKPLGRPSQNSRKWFATVELERLGRDPVWLDKAIRIVEKHVQQMNAKQRGQLVESGLVAVDTPNAVN